MIILRKIDWHIPEERQIQPIQPDHRIRALVAMVMPMPRRGQDHVAARHGDLLPFNGRKAIAAFDDEAQRERDVAVCGGRLAGEDELEAAVDGVGGVWWFCIKSASHSLSLSLRLRLLGVRILGFTSISTLLSASSAPTISPACISAGRISLYFHRTGAALGLGWGGTIWCRTVQSGAECFAWRDWRKVSCEGGVWVVVAAISAQSVCQ